MPSSIRGIDFKFISLFILVLQNSALVLVMRYSRTHSTASVPYLASSAVVMSELVKLVLSIALYIMEESQTRNMGSILLGLTSDIFGRKSSWEKMTVPAILYFIQNNLQYYAVSMLDAATFQVTYQLKILTTALFSVLLLDRSLTSRKWTSLLLLTIGIALVQLAESKPTSIVKHNFKEQKFLGLIAVGTACLLSGLAGVWFEKVLKGSKSSIFLRNIQLGIFSIIPGLLFGVYFMDREKVMENGFFGGYTVWTWATILCQAVGGLIVAAVVKYADNILKGFATSISIILSCIASIFIFNYHVTFLFALGGFIVLLATHLYGLPDSKKRLLRGIIPMSSAHSIG